MGPISPEGVKPRLVLRAPGHVLDAVVVDACLAQLRAHRCSQIDERLPAFLPHDEPDAGAHLGPHLEAARFDARANRRDERSPAEHPGRRPDDPRHDAAPPGVDGGDIPGFGVSHEDGNAIGDAYPDGKSLALGERGCRPADDGIRFAHRLRRLHHARSVDLLHLDDARGLERREERRVARVARRECVEEAHSSQEGRSQEHHGDP